MYIMVAACRAGFTIDELELATKLHVEPYQDCFDQLGVCL